MDEFHLLAAFRYVAMNPVKAKMVTQASDWAWSSTKAHLSGKDDGLVSVRPLLDRVDNVSEFFHCHTREGFWVCLEKGTIYRTAIDGIESAGGPRKIARATSSPR
jgi:putative transposase